VYDPISATESSDRDAAMADVRTVPGSSIAGQVAAAKSFAMQERSSPPGREGSFVNRP
jgi:hypothetical protein